MNQSCLRTFLARTWCTADLDCLRSLRLRYVQAGMTCIVCSCETLCQQNDRGGTTCTLCSKPAYMQLFAPDLKLLHIQHTFGND